MAIAMNPNVFGDLLWWLEDDSEKLSFASNNEFLIKEYAKTNNVNLKEAFDLLYEEKEL